MARSGLPPREDLRGKRIGANAAARGRRRKLGRTMAAISRRRRQADIHHGRKQERMENLCVRFHVRGRMEYDGKEWNYIGGKSGCSSVPITNLSIEALKRHLHDYIAISHEDLEETTLSWRLIEKERNLNFMCSLVDSTNVINMVRHVNRVADGYVDIFAVSPERTAFASSDEEGGFEEQGAVTKEQKEAEKVEHERQLEFLQIKLEHAHQVEYEQAEGRQIEQLDQQLLNQFVPNVARKMPVVRAPMNLQDKGKGIQIEIAHEGVDADDRSDSDYENVHEVDSGDSSADDDEAIFYRKYVEELKESVRRQMLGEDRAKVKEEFIVPENIKEEQEEGSECFDTDDDLSFDEDSDGEVRTRKTKHRVYDESAQVKEFEVGQSFTDSRQFKQALINYGLKEHHHLRFPKDERTRVLAECSWVGCPWSIYGSLVPNREIKDNPSWRIDKMQEAVLEDLLADVSESKCKRAKKIVMDKLVDNTSGEYARVFDYHMELVRSNPGSTVAVTLNPDVTDKPVFERMYVCLEGCKRVEGENYDSWYWFLSLLQKDIQINNQGDGWVVISDQQKGLIKAVNEIIPNAEHRMCARHIYANWRKEHRDKVFQKMFWACAKSSDTIQFNYNRAKLAQKTQAGAKDMMKTAPEHWCRANFRLGSYCDSVDNNMCESFNNSIMRARFYPVITSMEIIRRKVMIRIAENKHRSQDWHGTI
ncbi:hypothetical protein ACQ4PT_010238 [Festuca glaucescens]